MNQYKVTSIHDVYEDDFNDGELDRVNGWSESKTILDAANPRQALKTYVEKHLCMDYVEEHYTFEIGQAFTSRLVDVDGYEADENEKELWKQGKMKLYSENIMFQVHELVPALL